MAQVKELELLGETELQSKTPPGGRFPIGCPTLDLAATWDQDDRSVLVYRPLDQVVSKIHQVASPGEKAPEVCAVTWRPDGKYGSCISIYTYSCTSQYMYLYMLTVFSGENYRPIPVAGLE